MFEAQIKSEYNKLTQMAEGINASSFLSLTTVFSDEAFYSNFIESDARYQCFKALNSLSAESVFPDDLYENNQAEEWLMGFFGKYSIVNNDYVSELLKLAVEMKFNFLIRPVTTITSFIFSENLTISVKEAQAKLSYFIGHDYLLISANQVLSEISKNKSIVIKSEFNNKLRFRLNDYLTHLSDNDIVSLSDDIYNFLALIDSENFAVLALMIFYDDIRIYGIVEKLDSLKDNYPLLSQDNLLSLVNDLYNVSNDDSSQIAITLENDDNDIDSDEYVIPEKNQFDFINDHIENDRSELLIQENNIHIDSNKIIDDLHSDENTDLEVGVELIESHIESSSFDVDNDMTLDDSIIALENSINGLSPESNFQNSESSDSIDVYKETLNKIYFEMQEL